MSPASTLPRRHRSAVACQSCRARKVRCSVLLTGVPCVTCAQDQVQCVVIGRKRKRQAARTDDSHAVRDAAGKTTSISLGDRSGILDNDRENSSPAEPPITASTPSYGSVISDRLPTEEDSTELGDEARILPNENKSDTSNAPEERVGIEIAEAQLCASQRQGQVLFYSGKWMVIIICLVLLGGR